MDHDKFMQAVGFYEEAMRLRDGMQLVEAIDLFERAQNILVELRPPVPFCMAFIYDIALAYDLIGEHEKARVLFQNVLDLYNELAQTQPNDPAVENFDGLIWGIGDYLSLWKNASSDDDNYLQSITIRRWNKDKLPLKVFVDESEETGFDSDMQKIIMDGFFAWTESIDAIKCERTESEKNASIVVRRVADLGSAGGHTGFEEIADGSGKPQLQRVTIRISMRSHSSRDHNAGELRSMRSLTIHEAGHALGLDGHSPHATDLMYWKSPLLELSKRDINTLRLVYS